MKKIVLLVGLAVFATSAFADNYRLFWYERDKCGYLHGPSQVPGWLDKPYEETITAPSLEAAKREVRDTAPYGVVFVQ